MRAVGPQDLEQDRGEASSILNFASLHVVVKEDLPPCTRYHDHIQEQVVYYLGSEQ